MTGNSEEYKEQVESAETESLPNNKEDIVSNNAPTIATEENPPHTTTEPNENDSSSTSIDDGNSIDNPPCLPEKHQPEGTEPQNPDEDLSTKIPKEDKPIEEKSIPNPMCEVEYCFTLEDILGQESVISTLTSDNNGDLLFDESSTALKGKPTISREFWMDIELKNKVVRLKCYINENPRLLWKDIPSEQIVKPDKDYQAILSPRLDMIAVSYRGRLHANRGTYRDDDFYIGRVGRFTLSIVADGAGSAPLSSTGSKIFCREAGAQFAKLVEERESKLLDMRDDLQNHPEDAMHDSNLMTCLYEIFPSAALFGKKALMQMSTDNQVPLKHYHTTALLSITVQIASESYFCAAFQIGDGITAALTEQHLELLGKGDSGSFPGETIFVTSNGVFDDGTALLKRIKCYFCKEKPIVISMTDGVTDSYFKECPTLDDPNRWKQLIADISDSNGILKPAAEICEWLNYYIDQEHDDRTMSVIMYK